MSKELSIIFPTGLHDVPLHITQFCGPVKHGLMLQLTQYNEDVQSAHYITLTEVDAIRLMVQLEEWIYNKGV